PMLQPLTLKNWPLIPAYGALGKRNSIYSGQGGVCHLPLAEQEDKEDGKYQQGGDNCVQKLGVVQSPWRLAGPAPLCSDEARFDRKEYLREVMHTLELSIRKVRERTKRRTAEIGISLKDREQEEGLSLEDRLRKVEQAQKTAA